MRSMQLYDWNKLEQEQLNPRVARKLIHGANMTIARLEIRKGAVVPAHSHVHEQIATVEKGAMKFLIEGGEQIVRAGQSIAIPPHVPHGVEALEDSVVVDVFSPAREDWIRGDDAYSASSRRSRS
jgi:quercetin dioxygenase-like cupin family protein